MRTNSRTHAGNSRIARLLEQRAKIAASDVGQVARSVRRGARALTSDGFVLASGGAIVLSILLRRMKRREDSQFVGHWPALILLLGLYRQIRKVANRTER